MALDSWNQPLTDLYDLLTRTITNRAHMERIARFSGVDLSVVNLEGSIGDKWYNIIDQALKQQKAEALLNRMVSENNYPAITQFIQTHLNQVPSSPVNEPGGQSADARSLIMQGKLNAALDKLQAEAVAKADQNLQDEVIHLSARLADVQKGERMGTMASGDINLYRNQIIAALLDLVKSVD